MVNISWSNGVRLGFICVLGVILIFLINSIYEIRYLQNASEIIIPPELKQIGNAVSIGQGEPVICYGDKCEILTEKIFSILNEMNTLEFYLVLISITMLAFEVVVMSKNRIFVKK